MNKKVLLVVLLNSLIATSCFYKQTKTPPHLWVSDFEDGSHQTFHNNGTLYQEFYVKNGLLDSVYRWYWKNGNLATEFNVVNGYEQDLGVVYYKNGHKKLQYTNNQGVLEGPMVSYTRKGLASAVFWYNEGVSDTLWQSNSYYSNNSLKYRKYLNKFKFADNTYTYYYKNGQLNVIGDYKDNKKHGVWIIYNEDGSVKEKKDYTK